MKAGVLASVFRIHYGNTSVDTEGRQEPSGGLERQGPSGNGDEGSGKKRRQPKTGQLSGKDGKHEGPRKGRKGKANEITS